MSVSWVGFIIGGSHMTLKLLACTNRERYPLVEGNTIYIMREREVAQPIPLGHVWQHPWLDGFPSFQVEGSSRACVSVRKN